MFNAKRLSAARQRRRLTAKSLAEIAGLSPVTITRLETGQNEADEATVEKLAEALNYPKDFFYGPNLVELSTKSVSFRSLKAMTAKERGAAITAGELGVDLFDWVKARFTLPETSLPDLGTDHTPDSAARMLRQHWGLGTRPISNLLKILEAKGVRVCGIDEATANVDAFSFWRENDAFVFLNSFKSAERSIFDAAHELGHLVLHRHGSPSDSRDAENEANSFASSFLMPKEDVLSVVPKSIGSVAILRLKNRWKVSAMALAYRLHKLGWLTEWQHRMICIDLGKKGYRTGEPVGVEREVSVIWPQVLSQLWAERLTRDDIAKELGLPIDELDALLCGIVAQTEKPKVTKQRPNLRVVT